MFFFYFYALKWDSSFAPLLCGTSNRYSSYCSLDFWLHSEKSEKAKERRKRNMREESHMGDTNVRTSTHTQRKRTKIWWRKEKSSHFKWEIGGAWFRYTFPNKVFLEVFKYLSILKSMMKKGDLPQGYRRDHLNSFGPSRNDNGRLSTFHSLSLFAYI